MSDEEFGHEEFLKRWSRRKRKARSGEAAPQPEGPGQGSDRASSPDAVAKHSHPAVDLSKLPALEEIDAATDITAFLRKGIPQELGRAALRRAWTADPAIRDFVGLAESAWDFNDPNAMEGFGPLGYSAEQVDALVRRIVGGAAQAAGRANPLVETANIEQSARLESDSAQEANSIKRPAGSRPTEETTPVELLSGSAAPQPAVAEPTEHDKAARRHTHGGALPR